MLAFSSIILAGGKSTRLGRNKALELVGGERLVQRVVNSLSLLGGEIIVVRAHGQDALPLTSSSSIRTVWDIKKEGGLMVALYSGLLASSTYHNIVVGCDLPFLNVELLRYILRLAAKLSEKGVEFDAVVPRIEGKPERLHSLYCKSCLGPMERLMKQGRLKVGGLLEEVRVRYVEEEEIDGFDKERISFLNVNTEDDLRIARAIAQRLRSGG